MSELPEYATTCREESSNTTGRPTSAGQGVGEMHVVTAGKEELHEGAVEPLVGAQIEERADR